MRQLRQIPDDLSAPTADPGAVLHRRWSLPMDWEAVQASLTAVGRESFAVVSAAMRPGQVIADLGAAAGGERLRPLSAADAALVAALADSVRFLPQRHWKAGHTDVLLGELRAGRSRGLALFPPAGLRPVAYLDFKPADDGEVEIGFCMTNPDWRGRRLMTRLFGTLVLIFFDRRMVVSTAESNAAMRRTLSRFGFALDRRIPNDRVDGQTTLICTRAASTPFDLTAPAPVAG